MLEQLFDTYPWKEDLAYGCFCICAACLIGSVIVYVILQKKNRKNSIPLYRYYEWADAVLLVLFSNFAGLLTEPIRVQLVVFGIC